MLRVPDPKLARGAHAPLIQERLPEWFMIATP